MTQVVSFVNYTPAPRYDDEPWTEVDIEEGATTAGPWVVLETIQLDPVDADPSNPAARSLTTELAGDGDLWYRLIFRDGTGDEQQPTHPVLNRSAGGTWYVTEAELKEILHIQNETYADTAIAIAIEAASRMCDAYCQTRFYATAEVRYYSPGWGATQVLIDDLITSEDVQVHVDDQGDGAYATEWIQGTDYYLEGANSGLEGRPSTMLTLRMQATRQFPRYQRGVRVTGTFGWEAVPAQVKQACILLANRYLVRTRSAPLSVLVSMTSEAVSSARLGRLDADASELLSHISGMQTAPFRSVALG